MEGMNVCAIVPSLQPDEKFIQVIQGLKDKGFTYIIVVDDGSDAACRHYFDTAEEMGCRVLRHYINLGKGRAMKTAFNHYLNDTKGCAGVVTLDADNQHRPDDIVACAKATVDHPEAMILGCRNFDLPNVPKKSRTGNKTMCMVFRLFCGIRISDTQTGLHGISNEVLKKILEINGERFEYETNLLLELKKLNVPIVEVPIETVYIEENKSSHFHPVKDTLRIVRILLKFLFSSLSTTVLDLLLFMVLNSLFAFMGTTYSILIATVGARVVSSLCNYLLNKKLVFGGSSKGGTVFKYYILAAIQMGLSYGGVLGVTTLGVPSVVAKILVDTVLFLFSFTVQREWVFR